MTADARAAQSGGGSKGAGGAEAAAGRGREGRGGEQHAAGTRRLTTPRGVGGRQGGGWGAQAGTSGDNEVTMGSESLCLREAPPTGGVYVLVLGRDAQRALCWQGHLPSQIRRSLSLSNSLSAVTGQAVRGPPSGSAGMTARLWETFLHPCPSAQKTSFSMSLSRWSHFSSSTEKAQGFQE